MLRCTAVVTAICSLALSAAADSSVAALAAPGDCAQPSADFETPPLYEQPAGVGGSAAEHFAPNGSTGLQGLLPVDLTRTTATLSGVTAESVDLVGGVAEATGEGVSDAVGGAADAISDGLADVSGAAGDLTGGTLGTGGLTDGALGSGGLTDGALDTTTGAVDTLTGTATSTTTDLIGGLK